MVDEIFKGQITRSALGRQGFVGELFDIGNESLTSRSLLKSSFPLNLIERRDRNRMEFDYRFIERISDRFELTNVETELQLGIILGLITFKGSGKFLTEEKKSEKTVSCSLLCNFQTLSEKLFSSFDEIIQHIDLTALEDPQYTHMITEVNWGANCVLSLESTYQSDTERKNLEGVISSEISVLAKWLNSTELEGTFKKEGINLISKNNIKVKICADVLPEKGWPISVEGFCDFVRELPKLLKNVNDGKGKVLNYVMIPLDSIRKLAKLERIVDIVVTKIDESFLLSMIYFFEEIEKTKQKLNDLMSEMKENKKYVSAEELRNARKQYEDLCLKESELKVMISNHWMPLKTGKIVLKDLIRKVENFKKYNLNLLNYEEFLESYSPTLNKISVVKNYISKGVIYLGKGEDFNEVLCNNLSCEFIVLVISKLIEEEDPELYKNTCYFFLTLATDPVPNTKYVVVDFDFDDTHNGWFLNREILQTKCFHLKGNKIINWDLYGDFLADLEKDYAQLGKGYLLEYVEHRPGNRVILELVCPGFEKGTCSPERLTWNCLHCKNKIEYGFDDYFYCFCGKGPAAFFEFRCSNAKHGSFFVTATSEFLKNALSSLKLIKELNVLVIGQSGVGKSTWINGIVNYLTYESLNVARDCGVICTIPTSFTIYDPKTLKKHVIEIGNKKNEKTKVGQSETQYSHTYSFLWEDRYVRIIDTPGIGDTRGIDQDKKNLANIIDHIGHLKELHGVCILFKANDNRITTIFSYCLKELLIHLHKSVAKNIVFCFTNARSSFYSPGQTSVILEKLICDLGIQKELGLGQYNMFCLDNEAFLFLCSLRNREIQHTEDHINSFSQSWEISLKETKRLFSTVKNFKPHLLEETMSLIRARNQILTLSKSIAEISKTIQINVSSIERKKNEINVSNLNIHEWSKKLNFTEIHLESVPLKIPRTVCTSPSCVQYITYKSMDLREIEYKTHCHINCLVENVIPKTINNILLKNCLAIDSNGICQKCGCGWENHMHLTFTQARIEKTVSSKSVEKDIMEEESVKKKIEDFVKELESTVEKYRQEQKCITQTLVKFGMFLQKNAISFYNDSVVDYLEYLIKEEENKPFKSKMENKLLENLKGTLAQYNSEIQVLQDLIKEGNCSAHDINPQELYDFEQKLYNLELTGKSLKASVELSLASSHRILKYTETPIAFKKPKRNGQKLNKWTNWFGF